MQKMLPATTDAADSDEVARASQDRILNPKDSMGLARYFDATHLWTIRRHDDRWWLWDGTKYDPLPPEQLEAEAWKWMEGLDAFTPTATVVHGMLRALKAVTHTPPWVEMP